MTTSRLGIVIRDEDGLALRYVRHLAHPPEKVWRALTESEHLKHWFPCDLVGERAEGAELELPFWPEHAEAYGIEETLLKGHIHVWDPPRVFEWTWATDLLRFELAPRGEGTILTFTTWVRDPGILAEPEGPDETPGAAHVGAGYHVCLDFLERLLDGDTSQRLVDADPAPLVASYREQF